jgi:hypothetical protein
MVKKAKTRNPIIFLRNKQCIWTFLPSHLHEDAINRLRDDIWSSGPIFYLTERVAALQKQNENYGSDNLSDNLHIKVINFIE